MTAPTLPARLPNPLVPDLPAADRSRALHSIDPAIDRLAYPLAQHGLNTRSEAALPFLATSG